MGTDHPSSAPAAAAAVTGRVAAEVADGATESCEESSARRSVTGKKTTTMPTPTIVARSCDVHGRGNHPVGCAFSPDGLCVLTATASDNTLRLYDVPRGDGDVNLTSSAADSGGDDAASGGGDGEGVSSSFSPPTSSSSSSPPQPPMPWRRILSTREGDSVRGYAWYPRMDSSDPVTCIFLSTSREQPMHLIDAYDGSIRCSYRSYDDADAIRSANCVTFSPDGQRIFAGFDRRVEVFHTGVPGRDCDVWKLGRSRRSSDGQRGVVSAIDVMGGGGGDAAASTIPNVIAVGTYAGSIYLYDDRAPSGNPAGVVLSSGLCLVGQGRNFARKRRFDADGGTTPAASSDGTSAVTGDGGLFSAAKVRWFQRSVRLGVTQVRFSPDGRTLFAAARRSDSVTSWDVRMLSDSSSGCPPRGVSSYGRDGDTNQRLGFDLDREGHRLFVSSRGGCVKIYDVRTGVLARSLPVGGSCGDDAANGVSFDSAGGHMLAVSVGERRFESFEDDDDAVCDSEEKADRPPGVLELYKI